MATYRGDVHVISAARHLHVAVVDRASGRRIEPHPPVAPMPDFAKQGLDHLTQACEVLPLESA
ncbi:MAG TPA: hypothetical protein VK587_15085, partial [bacterium]|nr:hypothetical protein [bacterium]